MNLRPLVFGFLVTAFATAEEIPRAIQIVEPPDSPEIVGADRVISNSQQFRVTGGGATDRAALVVIAEEAKTHLLGLTEEKDQWADKKIPITIALHGKPGDPLPERPIVTKIFVNEVGYVVHLDVHLGRGIDPELLHASITAALIYERTLRDHPRDSEVPFSVPPWLVEGLLEANAWRMNQSDRRLYEALFKTGGLFKPDDIFSMDDENVENLDGAMRAAFRVSSGSLVMALLQQANGKAGFREFLGDVADFQGEMPALLRKHFPELNLSETSLAKWWNLQIANIGAQNLTSDVLSVGETEAQLREVLRLNLRTPEGIIQQKELDAWQEIAALSPQGRAEAVRLAQDALVRLSYRCFPSYRPLLAEYQVVLGALATHNTKNVAHQLVKLQERRATMVAKAVQARDFLDWFEITRAHETSGEFEDYVRLKERLKANPHQRKDEISKYLDRMDAIFSRAIEPKAAPIGDGLLLDLPPLGN
jgi:hypothetical protein